MTPARAKCDVKKSNAPNMCVHVHVLTTFSACYEYCVSGRTCRRSAPAETEASADDTFPARLQLAVVAVKAVVAGAGVVELVVVTVAASGAGLVPAPVVCRVLDAR